MGATPGLNKNARVRRCLRLALALAMVASLACTPRCSSTEPPVPESPPPATAPGSVPVAVQTYTNPAAAALEAATRIYTVYSGTENAPPAPLPDWADPNVPLEPSTPLTLDTDLMNSMELGASLEQVRKLLRGPGDTIASNAEATAILRWQDMNGNSIVARFENGVLVRRAALGPDGQPLESLPESGGRYLTREQFALLQPGISFYDVSRIIPLPAQNVGGNQVNVSIYRWVDERGSSFTARFENEKLVRKTSLQIVDPEEQIDDNPAGNAAAPGTSEAPPESDAALIARAETAPSAGASAEETRAREIPPGEPVTVAARPAGPAPPIRAESQVTSVAPPKRVSVVGETRRAREAETRDPAMPTGSYRPKAKLPEYRFGLRRGSYELVIENPTEETIEVGVRSGDNGGENVRVPAGQTRSLFVNRGNYRFYYIFDDSPYELNSGGGVNIDGDSTADVVVRVQEEGSEVRDMTLEEFWSKPTNY